MKARFLVTLALVCCSPVVAREWRSAEGGRTLEGTFVRLTGDQLLIKSAQGQPLNIKLQQLSTDDQKFAQAAQTIAEASAKMGPQAIETSLSLKEGILCRLGVKVSSGATLFTGEQFLLLGGAKAQPGTRLKDQVLYLAGPRTYHQTQGGPLKIRAFALSLEAAAEDALQISAGTLSAEVYEPVVDIVEATTIGFAVGEEGLVLVDSSLLEGASAISVDVGNNQAPGTVVASDPNLGMSILSAKGLLSVARLAPKKPVELGQPIYALSIGLTTTRRSVADPAISKGIISKLSGPGGKELFFQHDAAVDAESLGGVILSERGDVLGVMIPRSRIKGSSRNSASDAASASSLGTCVRTESLVPFLKSVPKTSADRAASTTDLQESGDAIKKATIIVRVTKESRREVAVGPTTPAGSPAGTATPPPATSGWSLSKAGIRHNAKCQYFNARYPCAETEGRACKACGG